MPRTWLQGLLFVIGFAIALALSPFSARSARGDSGDAAGASLESAGAGLEASYASLEARFHQMVNAHRRDRNLLVLARDPVLDAVARAHSADMARRRYLSHVSPEGLNPLHRIEAAGIEGFTLAAENAGQTNRDDPSREILEGWIASPVHRRNLDAPSWNRTGVGIARAADGTWYFTQLYLTFPR